VLQPVKQNFFVFVEPSFLALKIRSKATQLREIGRRLATYELVTKHASKLE
jgi:hypothetical protein